MDPVQAAVPELNHAEIAAVYYGQRIGGDFYDFVRVAPDRVLFGLLDVAGRLEDNHDIVSAAQHTFRNDSLALFAKEDVNEADAMVQLCLRLNRVVLQAEGGGVRSCPAFAGCYNETLGTVCYFNAGHTAGLVRQPDGVSELAATGLPLGLFSHATCDAPTIGLEPGAVLLLVSRGVVEGKRKSEEFGFERVKDTLQETKSLSAKEVCLSILSGVQQYMRTPPTHNDVTALALHRQAS